MSVNKILKTQLNDYDIQKVVPKNYRINEFYLSTMSAIVGNGRTLSVRCDTVAGSYETVIIKTKEKNSLAYRADMVKLKRKKKIQQIV